MTFSAKVVRIFIVSPSDVYRERKAIREIIHEWNTEFSIQYSTILLPVMWETHAIVGLGDSPQNQINQKLVDKCDGAIGIFWSKIGTPTGVAESASVEEIKRLGNAGKFVMLYFCNRNIPQDKIDSDQLRRLKEFKEAQYPNGLIGEFSTVNDLKEKIRHNLTLKAKELSHLSINESNEVNYATDNKFVEIIAQRNEIRPRYSEAIENVTQRFWAYGAGLGGFRDEYKTLIRNKVRQGVSIRLLAMHPRREKVHIRYLGKEFSFLEWKDLVSRSGNRAMLEASELEKWVFEENLELAREGRQERIELKFYTSLPSGALMIADNILFYSPTLISSFSESNSTIVMMSGHSSFQKFLDHYEMVWDSNEFSFSTLDEYLLQSHAAQNTKDLFGKRKEYRKSIQFITENLDSFIDHAKNKLLYNELAPLFLLASSRDTKKEAEFIPRIEGQSSGPFERIIDLGCGVGRHSAFLAPNYKVTGIDISEKEIELAKKLNSSAEFIVADMRNWKAAEKADLAICMWSTFNYLSTERDLASFFHAVSNNLKDNGFLLIDVKNPNQLHLGTYSRIAYAYPYEVSLNINKEVKHNDILVAEYHYTIRDVRYKDPGVNVVDQEVNRIYSREQILSSCSTEFVEDRVWGNYDLGETYDVTSSDRLIILLKKL